MALTPDHQSTGQPADDPANRQTVVLPGQRGGGGSAPGRRHAPAALITVANILWAALYSFVPVLVTVAALTRVGGNSPGFAATTRFALAAWLLAHGVPLLLGGFPLAIVPLALTVLAFWRLIVAGRNAVRASGAPVAVIALGIGIGYGVLGVVAGILADHAPVSVSVLRSGVTLTIFGGVGALIGGSVGGGLTRRWWRRVPMVIRIGVRAGAICALFVLAAGAAATGMAVAFGGGTASQMLRNYHAGVLGQGGITLICLVYAPNVTVWAAAYLAGPGFTLAGVPQLPVFAGLPSHAANGVGQLALLMPVLAGIAAGILVRRRGRAELPLSQLAVAGLCAGPVAGVLLAVAGYAAAGSLGSKLLARTGDVGWQFSVVGGLGVAVGTLLGMLAHALIAHNQPNR